MKLTRKQLKELIWVLPEKPHLEEYFYGAECGVNGKVTEHVLLPFRIGIDLYCKLDKKTGRYAHRKFTLATFHMKAERTGKLREALEKYQRWVDELWEEKQFILK